MKVVDIYLHFGEELLNIRSLRSWRDFERECVCFGCKAVKASGEAVRGLMKRRWNMPAAPPLARLRIPPAMQASIYANIQSRAIIFRNIYIWQGYLKFSYDFIFDRTVCVLVTFTNKDT